MTENDNSEIPHQEHDLTPEQRERVEEEKEIVEALIEKYGKPRDVVHKQYQYGADFTVGVLANGCCNTCAREGKVEQGHFACHTLSEDLEEAEKEGLVHRTFQGNNWWVVLDYKFSDYFETDEKSRAGWGEDS